MKHSDDEKILRLNEVWGDDEDGKYEQLYQYHMLTEQDKKNAEEYAKKMHTSDEQYREQIITYLSTCEAKNMEMVEFAEWLALDYKPESRADKVVCWYKGTYQNKKEKFTTSELLSLFLEQKKK